MGGQPEKCQSGKGVRSGVWQSDDEMQLMQRSMPEELMSRLASEAANELRHHQPPVDGAATVCGSTARAEGQGAPDKLPLAGRKRDSETDWLLSGPPPPHRRNLQCFEDPTDTWSNRGVRRGGQPQARSAVDGYAANGKSSGNEDRHAEPPTASRGHHAPHSEDFPLPGRNTKAAGRDRREDNPFARSLLAAAEGRQAANDASDSRPVPEFLKAAQGQCDVGTQHLLDAYLAGRMVTGSEQQRDGVSAEETLREGGGDGVGRNASEDRQALVPLRRQSRHHSLEAEMLKAQWLQANALFDPSPFEEAHRSQGLRTAAERASIRPLTALAPRDRQVGRKNGNLADQAAANAFTLFLHARSSGSAEGGGSPEEREASVLKRLQARVAQLEARNLAEAERAKEATERAAHLEEKLGKAKQQVESWRKLYLQEVHANKQRK